MYIVSFKYGKDSGIREFKEIQAEDMVTEHGVTSFFNLVNGIRSDVYKVDASQVEGVTSH